MKLIDSLIREPARVAFGRTSTSDSTTVGLDTTRDVDSVTITADDGSFVVVPGATDTSAGVLTTGDKAVLGMAAMHYESASAAATAAAPAERTFLRTAGHSSVGDGGAALYKKAASEPPHAFKLQTADGAWWEGVEERPVPEQFGATGDGSTDDIAALDAWADYCQTKRVIGQFGAKTYMVSRTLYLVGLAGYVGSEGTVIKATAGFATTFTDPVDGGLAAGLAPVVFFDGRTAAVAADPTRIPVFKSIKTDGNGVAAHGTLMVGILPVKAEQLRSTNTTKERFVFLGMQNCEVDGVKVQAGTTLTSTYAVAILNGVKNSVFTSMDITGTAAAAEGYIRLGEDASYPTYNGGGVLSDADTPNLLTFVGGVWEQIAAQDCKRALHVTHGHNCEFLNINFVGASSIAMIEIEMGCVGLRFTGGRANGKHGTTPLLINEGRGVVVDQMFVSLFDITTHLIENNGVGVVDFTPRDNGLFGNFTSVFGGTANARQNRVRGGRMYGNAAVLAAERYAPTSGFRWYHADFKAPIVYDGVDARWETMDGLPVPSDANGVNSWPVLTEADVTAGVLNHRGHSKVVFRPSVATTVSDIVDDPGRTLTIMFDNTNATIANGSDIRTLSIANVTPARYGSMTFDCIPATSISGLLKPLWIQRAGVA